MVLKLSQRDFDQYALFSHLLIYVLLGTIFFSEFQGNPYLVSKQLVLVSIATILLGFLGLSISSLFYFTKFSSKPGQFFSYMYYLNSLVFFLLVWGGFSSGTSYIFFSCFNLLSCCLTQSRIQGILIAGLTSVFLTVYSLGFLPEDGNLYLLPFLINLGSVYIFCVCGFALRSLLLNFSKHIDSLNALLKDQKALLETIFNSVDVGIFVLNPSGKLLSHNQRAMELMGSFSGFLGLIYDHFHRDRDSRNWQKLQLEDRTFNLKRSPLALNEGVLDAAEVIIVSDDTEAVILEEDLKKSEKLAAIGRLSAGLAHEIRNPLAGISGSVELLKASNGGRNSEDQRLFSLVIREIDRLNELISDFLGFARPDISKNDSVNMSHFISEMVELLKFDSRFANHSIDFQLDIESFDMLVDRNKLKQAFLNLVINSLQACIEAQRAPVIKISGGRDQDFYRVVFEDNGVGIPESRIDQVFEPFHTTKDRGTGLGLAITHRILESHGAHLSLKSEAGQGTSISVRFPIEEKGQGENLGKTNDISC